MNTSTTSQSDPSYLQTAIRVHPSRNNTEPISDDQRAPKSSRRAAMRSLPQRALIFDCETSNDAAQRLLFGVWRIYVDDPDTEPGSFCIEEGIFYADDLPERDPDGYRTVCQHAASRPAAVAPGCSPQLRLLSRTEFVNKVLWPWGYKLQATIVGFNLPFDLSRLAVHASAGRGRFRGAISLQLWSHEGGDHPYRPRIAVKTIDSRRALVSFTATSVKTDRYRGRFLDLATLTFAHSDQRLSLEHACERFGVPYTKRLVPHGLITDDYVTYCREDVAATAALYRATESEHARHPIALPARSAFSAAGIGRSYWAAMGITPFAERESPTDATVAGYGMAAFFGGRAECHIRGVEVPVVYVDFLSMYMTCNALMGTWRHITANHTSIVDTTREIRALIADPNLRDRCFDSALWRQLHTLVEVDPNGATLPVRARFDNRTFGIGVTPLQSTRDCWYPLADIIAAALLGGPVPVIKRALQLVPSDDQLSELRNVCLRGQVEINPKRHDFFAAVVEQRHRTRNDDALAADERKRLEAFLKVLANSTGYGILAQYDRTHEHDPISITVHTDRDPFTITNDVIEESAAYTNPPLAACVTGASRLMLAMLEHEVTRRNGTYAFCDTDSMAIVATETGTALDIAGETVSALSWATVNEIVDQFTALNPYDATVIPNSILEIESENYDDHGQQRELRCYAISAKRYQLTATTGDNVKASAHGLGHLVHPTTRTDDDTWIRDAWAWLRNPDAEPDWLDLPALSRITITSPDALRWFQPINRGLDYPDRIKPHNFLLLAYPDPLDHDTAQPITPYRTEPTGWETWTWIDRTTGQPTTVHTHSRDGYQRTGTRILTYRDILTRYHQHPEHKSLNQQGEPCRGDTLGILRRRPVHAIEPVTYIGKEAHDLDHRSVGLTDENDTLTYTNQDPTWANIVAVLTTVPTATIAKATGVGLRTVQRARAGLSTPHPRDRQLLHDFGMQHARTNTNARRTDTDEIVLYRFRTQRNSTTRHDPA